MPLEIKELHIKVTVNPGSDQGAKPAAPDAPSGGGSGKPADQSAIIAACVEQVLEILKEKMES